MRDCWRSFRDVDRNNGALMAKKESGVNPELEKALNNLMKEAFAKNSTMSLMDKMRIVDRSLKLEMLKAKMKDDGFGSGFSEDEDE